MAGVVDSVHIVLFLLLRCVMLFLNFTKPSVAFRSYSSISAFKSTSALYSTSSLPPNSSLFLAVEKDPALESTARWLNDFVLPLKLCPFAYRPLITHPLECNIIPYHTTADNPRTTLEDELSKFLARIELESSSLSRLSSASSSPPPRKTSLLVLVPPPSSPSPSRSVLFDHLASFRSFVSFVNDRVGSLPSVSERSLQVLTFHPRFTFQGSKPGSAGNEVGRSPLPTIHLLREAEVSAAVDAFKRAGRDTSSIWERNKEVLERLGEKGIRDVKEGRGAGSAVVQKMLKGYESY